MIDDLFLRKLPASAGDELADVLMSRYEKCSTIVTSNRPVEDWAKLLGDVVVVTPLLDRLMHHAHLLKFEGKVGGSKKPLLELRSAASTCNHPARPAGLRWGKLTRPWGKLGWPPGGVVLITPEMLGQSIHTGSATGSRNSPMKRRASPAIRGLSRS